MAKIIVSGSIIVSNGPQIAFNQTLDVDAYDKIDVLVKAGAKNRQIELQPGAADQVQFLAIVSDWYGDELSFKINKSEKTDIFKLDRPLLCMGKGGIALFDVAPQTLFLSNSTEEKGAKDTNKEKAAKDANKEKGPKDANIQILIGRDATPQN